MVTQLFLVQSFKVRVLVDQQKALTFLVRAFLFLQDEKFIPIALAYREVLVDQKNNPNFSVGIICFYQFHSIKKAFTMSKGFYV
jgi:hypothetical protein